MTITAINNYTPPPATLAGNISTKSGDVVPKTTTTLNALTQIVNSLNTNAQVIKKLQQNPNLGPISSDNEDYFSNSKATLQKVAATDTPSTPLSPQVKSTVDSMSSSINNITNLTTRITANNPGNQVANVGELGYQLNNLATITFATANQANFVHNMPLMAAMLMVTVDMTNVMGIYVNYAQQQLQQMNKMQVLVQNMVNAAVQLSAELQKVLNVLIQQSIQANQDQNLTTNAISPPNDMYATNSQSQAQQYVDDNNYAPVNLLNSADPTPNPPFGVIPTQNSDWPNVGMASPMGTYCLTQAGVAYMDFPDYAPDFNQGGLDTALGNAINNGDTSASEMFEQGNTQTGVNMCFVVTQAGSGVNVPGSLSLPADLFNMIPDSYKSTTIATSSMAQATYDSENDSTSLNETINTSYSNPGNAQVGYLNMGMLSAICKNVLTLASTYLPTGGYNNQFTTAFGTPSAMPPAASSGPTQAGPISIKTMASMMQSISQIPSNLSPTISSFQQQIESMVQAVTQLNQMVNQIIPNLSMK